jgi:phenylacetate-CoA ligase
MDPLFARYLTALEQTEWLPRPQLVAYQHDLMRRIVRHAYDNVPFYRDRLACLFHAGDEPDLTRWSEVAIVTRAEAAAHAAEMRAASLPAMLGPTSETRTSGSTGIPLQIVANRLTSVAANAALTRLARWWKVDVARPLACMRLHKAEPPAWPDGRHRNGWSWASPESDLHELDLMTPVEQQIEWLLRHKAPYWRTSASNALQIAYAATPAQARELGVELIFAIAETVFPRTREIIRERLGARIAAIYSCEEVGFIATQCPVEPVYHVVAENAWVEILREDATPAAPGELGQVVLTGFYNYAMPFIRYAIGDIATVGPATCACGRALPVIAQVEGRSRYAFVFKDGSRVWPRLWDLDVRAFVSCREFQLAQVDRERVEFRYVPDDAGAAPDAAGLADYLRRKLHPSAQVALVPMERIPRGRGGKIEPFVSAVAE